MCRLPLLPGPRRRSRPGRAIARYIHEFIQNTRSGALGVTGSILLIFAAISMLSRIEDTFNDIWGVARGRSWFMRIVLYWGVISLAPMLLIVALGLATGPHLEGTRKLLTTMPFVSNFVFQFLPVVLLCLTFALFYALIPNTKVHWGAALVGGLAGGILFHLNNVVSVLYVSRVVSNSKIYGSLGLVPVFMIGLYFSWLILLFGAQVAYAYQNRATYFEEKQVENINQRGREFIALRLMTCIGQRFVRGEPPPSAVEIAAALAVPTRLVQQIMQTLSRRPAGDRSRGGRTGLSAGASAGEHHLPRHSAGLARQPGPGIGHAGRADPQRSVWRVPPDPGGRAASRLLRDDAGLGQPRPGAEGTDGVMECWSAGVLELCKQTTRTRTVGISSYGCGRMRLICMS